MRLGKTLKIIAIVIPLLLIAVVVGAIAVLMTTDFNKYKPQIAEQVKKATGRDLNIAGDLKVGISLTPSVSVSDVTLSNANWGTRPEMVKVDHFEAQMAVIPLAFGVIDIHRVVLEGADILLEVDKKGRANFDFQGPGAKEPAPAAAEQPPAGEEGGTATIPVVREVLVRDSRLLYTDARSGASHEARIDELTINGEGMESPIELAFQGGYNKADIRMNGDLGAPKEALSPTEPYPVDLEIEAGGANIAIAGTIAEPTAAKGLDLKVSVEGKELGALSSLAGAEVPPLGAYSMSTKVTGEPATALNLVGFKGALAGSDVAGDVTVNLTGKRPRLEAKLKSKLIDVDALTGAASGAQPPADGASKSAEPAGKLFPDDPLPVEGLRAVDAQLAFDADLITAAGAKLQNAQVGLALNGGNLTVKPLKAAIAEGAIDGSINLDGRKKTPALAAKLALSRINLDTLLTDLQVTEDIEGQGNVDIDVTGQGESVAKIMAALNGRASVLMGNGRMKTSFLQNMLGGTGNLLNQVLDKGKAGYTLVNCAVADFPVNKGIATAKALYIDTETRGIIGKGTINLRNETLDLVMDPRNREKMEKVVLPVHITGTLLSPEYEIDKQAAAAKLTGELGIDLPQALKGTQGGSDRPLIEGPCAPPSQTKAEPAATAPTGDAATPPASTEPKKPLEGAEEKLKEGLKGLLKD